MLRVIFITFILFFFTASCSTYKKVTEIKINRYSHLKHSHEVDNGGKITHSHAAFCLGNLLHVHKSYSGKATKIGMPYILKKRIGTKKICK